MDLIALCKNSPQKFTQEQRNELIEKFSLCGKCNAYPFEVIDKILRFNLAIKLHFKTQVIAAEELKVTQSTMSRYMRGVLCIPYHLAKEIQRKTNQEIQVDDICYSMNDLSQVNQ